MSYNRFYSERIHCRPRTSPKTVLAAAVEWALIFVCLAATTSAQAQSAWQTEVVDDGNGEAVGTFTSLAIDGSGGLHISYSNRNGTELRYAFRGKRDSHWYTMVVDRNAGSFDSLAVDSKGQPHIVYNSLNLTGLHYAHWDGTGWQKIIIDPIRTNHYTSIQLDGQDHPRISYYREEYPDRHYALYLKYAYYDGKTWYIQTVDHRFGSGKWNSIALDRSARPYIAYSMVVAGNLGLAFLDGTTWKYSVADARGTDGSGYVGYYNSVVLDSEGQPHIAYLDGTTRKLRYAWRQGDTWVRETVDLLGSLPSEPDHFSLKLDQHGRPHIAYFNAGSGSLKYASRGANGWHTEVVESGNVGEFPSLCFDENDQPFISYSAAAEGQLRIAHPRSPQPSQQTQEEPTRPIGHERAPTGPGKH